MFVEVHAGDPASGSDNHCDNITNSLAAFLIGMGERHYYACSNHLWTSNPDWPSEPDDWLDDRPEYSKPLGKPLGVGVRSAEGVWTRNFTSGTSAEFDERTNSSTLRWADGEVQRGTGPMGPDQASCKLFPVS